MAGQMIAQKVAAAYARRGVAAILRHLTTTLGPMPAVNPPIFAAPVLSAAVAQGATVISLNAADAQGQLLAGDTVTLGGVPYLVGAPVLSRAPGLAVAGFDNVPLQSPLKAPFAAGTPVTLSFAADQSVMAMLLQVPMQLAGADIVSQSVVAEFAAYGLTAAPVVNDILTVLANQAFTRTITAVTPVLAFDTIVKYRVQAT